MFMFPLKNIARKGLMSNKDLETSTQKGHKAPSTGIGDTHNMTISCIPVLVYNKCRAGQCVSCLEIG